MTEYSSIEALAAKVGQEVALSDWLTITQEMINQFANATHDHQWIHVDTERAKSGPFGSTIAHGYMTLALIAGFADAAIRLPFVKMGINYGLNKVRFMAPVPVNSRLRARFKLASLEELPASTESRSWQYCWEVSIEREGADKPVCVAQTLARIYA